ncbi:MAG: hypothetical protein CMG15_07510 [Candidatus Marinimicrobia bacterium]|nr:hypothetical protein [Candidatus Neomarinimicrobiota bacterium]|tara:strand:- start:409 stop:837 length:429 start_codon:yes stop_codon:yes gene_type:complete
MKLKIFILIYLIAPFLFAAKPKFSDHQIIAMTPHYFERNHTSPELLGVNIYKSRQGRVYQIDIQVDRNRVNDDLSFAYSALTNMGQYAKKPIKQFIVVMHSDNYRNPPQVCIGKAKCSIDFWVHEKGEYQSWYKDCIHFKEL